MLVLACTTSTFVETARARDQHKRLIRTVGIHFVSFGPPFEHNTFAEFVHTIVVE